MTAGDATHRNDTLVATRSAGATVARSAIAKETGYREYREVLRWDFWFACAYCNISECEAAAVRFTIDHYLPRSRYPELVDDYLNLMWSCGVCNEFKGNRPSAAAAQRGCRVFRPDFDDPNEHFAPDGETGLAHKTENVGRYTIEALNLNRPPLRRLRKTRARLGASQATIVAGLRALRGMRIQSLPIELRARFVRVRDDLLESGQQASDTVDDLLVRELSRSELIDRPGDATQDSMARREYLRSVNAALPDSASK